MYQCSILLDYPGFGHLAFFIQSLDLFCLVCLVYKLGIENFLYIACMLPVMKFLRWLLSCSILIRKKSKGHSSVCDVKSFIMGEVSRNTFHIKIGMREKVLLKSSFWLLQDSSINNVLSFPLLLIQHDLSHFLSISFPLSFSSCPSYSLCFPLFQLFSFAQSCDLGFSLSLRFDNF